MTTRPSADGDDRPFAEELASLIVDAARKAGASACDATVGIGVNLSASARDGAIEDVSRSASRCAGVRVIVDGRLGFAASSDAPLGNGDVDEFVRSAIALARLASPAEHNAILVGADGSTAAWRNEGDALRTWDVATAETVATTTWAMQQALAMDACLRAEDAIATVRDVTAGVSRSVFALATSTGFIGSRRGTAASMSCSAVVEDGARKQIGGWSSSGRAVAGLQPADEIAREAARRARERRGARKLSSTRAPVIFDPMLARGFVASILGAMSGESIARRMSFLAGKKGEVVFIARHALLEDPLLVGGIASRAFDGEGQRCVARPLIDDDGRITTWLHDARSAARLGEAPTGHASRGGSSLPSPSPSNVTLTGGAGDLAAIIASTKRGLLATHLLGRGPDPVSGDYSRGAAGFWIEDGAIAYPVEEITIAGTAQEMMRGIDVVGADLDVRGAIRTPSIRFAELAISGR